MDLYQVEVTSAARKEIRGLPGNMRQRIIDLLKQLSASPRPHNTKLMNMSELVAPQTDVSRWNLTLLDFGALVCTALKPRCSDCPLQERCNYNLLGGRN
ncbi:hypothetical protein ACE1B6_06850 [Aerosakkonemataceae cyanobacterium BLCC-F154]|uniref:HhH-GPD domain-containing protein n=1 Tax=Floridaenema fluviatile BLCC-F154 TaxID=3153640 RepID=A0ABV4YAR1_9CYAN